MSIDAVIATRAPWTPQVLRDVIALSRDLATVAFIAEDHPAALVEAHPATIEYLMWAAGFAAKHNAVGLGRVVASVLAVLTGARPPRSQVLEGCIADLNRAQQRSGLRFLRRRWRRRRDGRVERFDPGRTHAGDRVGLPDGVARNRLAPDGQRFEHGELDREHAGALLKNLQQLGRPTTDAALRAIATFHGVPPQILGVDLDAPRGAR